MCTYVGVSSKVGCDTLSGVIHGAALPRLVLHHDTLVAQWGGSEETDGNIRLRERKINRCRRKEE